MFESEEEAMAHFFADYGAGLDMMQEPQAATDRDPNESDPETRH